jgi:hypothetical protein
MKLTKEQLASLTKEQKLKLVEAIQEKKRRALAAKPAFKPHPGQLRVIQSKALERYLFCGNGFGKSAMLVNELDWAAKGYNPITGEHSPVPAKICLIIDTPEKIEEIVTEYRRWHVVRDDQLHKKGRAYWSSITYDNGSTVTVMTHEVSDLKPEGSQWTHVFADEPPPQWLFNAVFRGGRIKGRPMRTFMAGTPVKAAWLRTEVYDPWVDGELPYVECFTGDSDENRENLEEGWLDRFAAKLDDKERRIRLKGEFFDLEGVALAHLLKPQVHILPAEATWNPENPCVLVFDPAPAKAHVAVVLGVDENDLVYVVDEYKEKANARRYVESIIDLGWFSKYRIMDIVYDSLGNTENLMGESYKPFGVILNEVLKENGLGRARATNHDEKSDEDFIERIRDVLVIPEGGLPKLRFFQHCKGSYSDVKTVQWYEDKTTKTNKTKLDIRKKDFLACVKYGLATNLFYDKPRRQRAHYVRRPVYGVSTPHARTALRARRMLK